MPFDLFLCTFNSHLEWTDRLHALHVFPCLLSPQMDVYVQINIQAGAIFGRKYLAVSALGRNGE
jgi:hypothetical protein